MEKQKLKRRPQNFFNRFVEDYIVIRRDFRFEVERDPDEIREALNTLWRRNKEYYNLSVNRLEDKPIWEVVLILWHRSYETETTLKISKDDGPFTLVEGTVRLHDMSPIFFMFFGMVISVVMALLIIYTQDNRHIESMRLILYVGIGSLLLGIWGRYTALKDHKKLLSFLDRLITKEDNDLDFWWQGQYLKDKKLD